ncbi:MAG: class I SAM-dependent methyltransferase [Myxococcota bacterium]
MNPKNEIVAVARGYYALPILMSLARKGIVKQLLGPGVKVDTIDGNHRNLQIVLGYLRNLGWLACEDETYVATELGAKVLRRSGAFGILFSYRPYIANLDQLLFDAEAKVHVHRDENVIGSGEAHVRKYFSRVSEVIRKTRARYVLDVGCGDGTFLNHCKSCNPDLQLIGVDYSERALSVTRGNVEGSALLFHGNVSEPLVTLEKLKSCGISPDEVLVSVWFIFHEVLGMQGVDLSTMLQGYRQLTPQHGMLIGEIFDIDHKVLAHHHNETAVPEFNLFHDLSGQKLFSIEAWNQAIDVSGFTPERFIGLDDLPWQDTTFYGSGIWYLK